MSVDEVFGTTLDERMLAGEYWDDHDLVFCQPTGRPIDATADARDWRELLASAGVRRARVHDARYTTATLLLVQGVDPRTVMGVMGWTEARVLSRYRHVIDELRIEAARRIGEAIWV